MNIVKCIAITALTIVLLTVPIQFLAEESVEAQEISDVTVELDEQYEPSEADLKTDLETAISINDKLFDLYGTWTAVIGIVLILVSVVGIAVPVYMNAKVDNKIRRELIKFKKVLEKSRVENIKINNALMLSASQEYWSSNEILEKCLNEDQSSVYLHLLVGRNVFLAYEKQWKDSSKRSEDQIKAIQKAVEYYIFAIEHSSDDNKYYNLGAVFENSVVHELCILTGELLRYSTEEEGRANYHKLAVKVIRTIEKVLHYDSFDDIANDDQTNVYLMFYKLLNFDLAKSYLFFGNIMGKEQFEYALKLFTISADIAYDNEISECKEALDSLQ
ncbi:MAG: hypothetical protein LUE20_03780 [Oscillospiraceae bacterium]|nr:hypothetical protein [Oscillospiraceae bacterium]